MAKRAPETRQLFCETIVKPAIIRINMVMATKKNNSNKDKSNDNEKEPPKL